MSLVQAEARPVVWSPQPGSQPLFLTSPYFETLYEGTRGPGKTDALLVSFAQHVGRGWGPAWRGVLFRQEYKPLEEVVVKAKKLFRRAFPTARWLSSKSDYKWVWPGGEELLFRAFKTLEDYWDYHGHEYPWVAFEELTAWIDLTCYHAMKSCCRSSVPGIPRMYRSTTNPWGKGHNAVKAYFIDPAPPGVPFDPPQIELPEGFEEVLAAAGEPLKAVRIRGHWSENLALMRAQPNYPRVLAQSATNAEQLKAWLAGDWEIVAGGMFDDVWSKRCIVRGWPPKDTPRSWRIDRAFDYGSSKPFSVGWWAESDGTTAPDGWTYPRGSLFRIAEWYGWNGSVNTGVRMGSKLIGAGIVEKERDWGLAGRVEAGPADTSIWDVDDDVESIADKMAMQGATFVAADKKPGSRKVRWATMRDMLKAASARSKDEAGLYCFESCRQYIRTIPTLPRDEKDPDDVDTDAEDHIADETGYRVLAPDRTVYGGRFKVV